MIREERKWRGSALSATSGVLLLLAHERRERGPRPDRSDPMPIPVPTEPARVSEEPEIESTYWIVAAVLASGFSTEAVDSHTWNPTSREAHELTRADPR